MTDPTFNNLGNLIFEEFNALCPQGEHAPGPEPLSPAAQAVLDAATLASWKDYDPAPSIIAAAALRALADYLQRCSPWSDDDPGSVPVNWCTAAILAIATELEGTNDPA